MLERKKCDECGMTYWRSDNPPLIRFTGIKVEQKGKRFYVVRGKARDFDRLTVVPRIEFDQDNKSHAEMVLQGGRVEKWQRPLAEERVADISKFFQDDRNYLVNAAVISLPVESVQINKLEAQGIVEIEADSRDWMMQECPSCGFRDIEKKGEEERLFWFDRCPEHGCNEHIKTRRPGIIIDGQHRIRGIHGKYSHEEAIKEQIVATVLPGHEGGFISSEQAKIFTEITTTSEDLEDHHKIYLLYKFGLRAPIPMRVPLLTERNREADFREGSELGPKNRRAYETVCKLCTRPGPWEDMIRILGDRSRGDYIDAKFLLALISSWFESDGPFEEYAPRRVPTMIDDPVEELNDYLRAVKDTWDTHWSDNPRSRVGPPQRRGLFYVILLLFEDIAEKIDQRAEQRTYEKFKEELEPLEDINWSQEWAVLETPDKNRRLLLGFLRHKLETGEPPDLNLAISKRPDDFDWTDETENLEGETLSDELPIHISWNRTFFAYRTADLMVEQGEEILHESGVRKTEKEIGAEDISGLSSETDEPVRIRVIYNNINGSKTKSLEMEP